MVRLKYNAFRKFKYLNEIKSECPKTYSVESEIRALFKLWEPTMKKVFDDGQNKYVEFPIGIEDYGYTFTISEIVTNESGFDNYGIQKINRT